MRIVPAGDETPPKADGSKGRSERLANLGGEHTLSGKAAKIVPASQKDEQHGSAKPERLNDLVVESLEAPLERQSLPQPTPPRREHASSPAAQATPPSPAQPLQSDVAQQPPPNPALPAHSTAAEALQNGVQGTPALTPPISPAATAETSANKPATELTEEELAELSSYLASSYPLGGGIGGGLGLPPYQPAYGGSCGAYGSSFASTPGLDGLNGLPAEYLAAMCAQRLSSPAHCACTRTGEACYDDVLHLAIDAAAGREAMCLLTSILPLHVPPTSAMSVFF